MSLPIYKKIDQLIRPAEHILLLTDERIDGDTMGSTMGLYHALKELGKRVEVYSPKPLPETFTYLPQVDVIRRDLAVFDQESVDLLIISDCSDGAYLKNVLPRMKRRVPLVSFDHHATNPFYGSINLVESTAASTADVAWRFVKAMGYPVTPEAAQCFMTGIVTDTMLFSTPNTSVDTLDASAELVSLGASLPIIIKHNMMNRSVAALKLWGLAMARLVHDPDLNATVTAITLEDMKKTEADDEDASGISNFLHTMLDSTHEVVAIFRETDDHAVKGSIRSRGRDIAKLAEERFGGGGHKLAAGFKVLNAKLTRKPDNTWEITSLAIDKTPTVK